jgi:hypothetical protein
LLILEAGAFAAHLDDALHVATLGANEAACDLKLFVIVDLYIKSASVFNIIVVIIIASVVICILLAAAIAGTRYYLLCLYTYMRGL